MTCAGGGISKKMLFRRLNGVRTHKQLKLEHEVDNARHDNLILALCILDAPLLPISLNTLTFHNSHRLFPPQRIGTLYHAGPKVSSQSFRNPLSPLSRRAQLTSANVPAVILLCLLHTSPSLVAVLSP